MKTKLIKCIFTILTFSAFLPAFSLSQNEVFKMLASHKITEGNFTQTKTISKLNRKLSSSGTYLFSDKEVTWNTTKPFPSKLTITETQMLQTLPNGTVQKMDFSSNPTFSSIAKTIKSIFENDELKIRENFETNFIESENGKWKITMTPKNEMISKAIKSIEVEGTVFKSDSSEKKSDSKINRMLISESNGDLIEYLLD